MVPFNLRCSQNLAFARIAPKGKMRPHLLVLAKFWPLLVCRFVVKKLSIPVWQNWGILGKHARAMNLSGNMLPRFPRFY